MRYFLQFLVAIQIALLSQAHAQSVTDDQRMLDYLVETSAAKEASAIAAYRNRSTQLAITELSELVRIYQAIAGIKSLADAERQYWYYMLVIANGRLGRAYGWVPNEKARVESYERAIQYSQSTNQRPVRSVAEVEALVESVDSNASSLYRK